MKKLVFLLISLLLSASVIGQTALIPNIQSELGMVVDVPVMVTDWNDIVCFTVFINFDPAKLEFLYAELWHPEMLIHEQNGRIGMCFVTEVDSITHPYTINGELAHLYFQVNGTSELKFGRCEVVQYPYTFLNIQYTNGSVFQGKSVSKW